MNRTLRGSLPLERRNTMDFGFLSQFVDQVQHLLPLAVMAVPLVMLTLAFGIQGR